MRNYLRELPTSMFNPLPEIVLLPLARIWFDLGNGSPVFLPVRDGMQQLNGLPAQRKVGR